MQLHVEFMNTPRGSLSRAANAVKQADGGIFWWTIAIVILMALAAFSWIGSIYIFTHPEKPLNYKLLSQIDRLETIQHFTEKDRPAGKSLTPPELYQKFYPFTEENLTNHNSLLRRNYITNFKNRSEKPYYVRGRFKVVHSRPLEQGDVFPQGLVARAVAVNEDGKEYRNVVVEYVLPTASSATAGGFAPGDLLDIDSRRSKKRLWGAVVNIHRQSEETFVFTVVPLMYGEHLIDPETHEILTALPPARLNMSGLFPITDQTAGGAGMTTGRLPDLAAVRDDRFP